MKLIEKKDNQIIFTAELTESLANSIRRYLNHVSILAIDDIEISKNDSPLYDETVAHRFGLIPLKMDKSFNEKSEVELNLKVKKEGFVKSGELTGKTAPVYENIPITFLNKNQELNIKATARLGKGFEHSKFSPGLMFYRDVSEIILNKNIFEEVKKVFKNVESKDKGDKVIILDNKKKEVVDICEAVSERNNKEIEVKNTGDLMITLESFGQLSVENIFLNSIEELKKDLKDFSKKISK